MTQLRKSQQKPRPSRLPLRFAAISGLFCLILQANAAFDVLYSAEGSASQIKVQSWSSQAELERLGLKSKSFYERDAETQQMQNFKGVLVQDLLEKALKSVAPEKKAQIDLVIFQNRQGQQVLVPRYFVTKYPLLLALQRPSHSEKTPQLVVPFQLSGALQDKMRKEVLPLESYGLSEITSIELANYREKYGKFFLKRRTDPASMKGEKLFVQNCLSCHAVKQSRFPNQPAVEDLLKHPKVGDILSLGVLALKKNHVMSETLSRFSEHDRKALQAYFMQTGKEQIELTASH